MKASYFFITIILSAFTLSAQWSTDPNNNLIVGYGQDPHLCGDSTGGCYITYNYGTLSYPQKLAVERLNKYGYKPWGDKKQILGELPEQWQAEIIEDGEGGVIVSYQENEWIPPAYFNSKVRVQKVDSNGNFLWGETGVRVTLTEINQSGNQQVSDGEGGCIIVWQDYDGKYWVNRINIFGQRVWTDSGKVLGISAYSERPRIIRAADGNYFVETGEYIYRIRQNGEIMLWESTIEWGLITATPDGGGILHSSIWNPSFYKLIAQRRDTLGNNLWQEPYVEVGDSIYINTQLRIQCNNGYYFYGWSGTKNGMNRVAQFQALRADGSKLFPEGSILLSNNTPLSVAGIVPSESSKTIFIWNDATISSSTISQLYDTLGNKLWDENGIIVSYPAIAYETITDCQSGFITSGPIDQFKIVAQQVNKFGQLGEIITEIKEETENNIPTEATLYQNYPNPFNSTTLIRYQIPKERRIQINLYSILGEKILTIYEGEKSAGVHTINFSSDELPSGIYFYSLETNSSWEIKKLTILK